MVGEGGAFLAGLIDPLPGNNYSPGFGDELGDAARSILQTLDIGGGEVSKYKNAINIDPKALDGFKGTISEFVKQFAGKAPR